MADDGRRDGLSEFFEGDRVRLTHWSLQFEGVKQAAEFFGRRKRKFVLLPEGSAVAGNGVVKRVTFIRHGEGVHNAFRNAEKAAGRTPTAKRHNMHEVPAELHDPPLTEKGRDEAARARAAAKRCAPQLLVTSPLRRAVQTLQIVFADHLAAGVPAVAHELCREQFHGLDPSIYDSRRSRDELQAEFPSVDFSAHVLPSDDDGEETRGDPLWWHCGSPFGACEDGVQEAAMVEHAWQLMCWLMSRPESEMAVATHCLLLLALHHGALAPPGGGRFASPQVFHTGELRSILICEEATASTAAKPSLAKWARLLQGPQDAGPREEMCGG